MKLFDYGEETLPRIFMFCWMSIFVVVLVALLLLLGVFVMLACFAFEALTNWI